jgi:hypothetical protein
VSYDKSKLKKDSVACVDYTFHGTYVGSAQIRALDTGSSYSFESSDLTLRNLFSGEARTYYIDVKKLIIIVTVFSFIFIFATCMYSFINSIHYGDSGKGRRSHFRRRHKSSKTHHYH